MYYVNQKQNQSAFEKNYRRLESNIPQIKIDGDFKEFSHPDITESARKRNIDSSSG